MDKYRPYLSHPLSLILYGIIIPFICLMLFFSKNTKLETLGNRALFLKKKSLASNELKNREEALLKKVKGASSNFVCQKLEKMVFLKSEIENLQTFLAAEPQNEEKKERLQFLKRKNVLRFKERNFKQVGKFQQVELILDHPVEIDAKDLKELFHQIENGKNAPYFVVQNLEINRKKSPSDEEVYLLNLKLIKYEFNHEI